MLKTSTWRKPGIDRVIVPRQQLFLDGLRKRYTKYAVPLALIFIASFIFVSNMGGWVSLATVLIASAVLLKAKETPRSLVVKVLTLTVAVTALDYLGWRFRVVNWDAWWIGVPLIAAELFGILHTLGFQFTVWPRPAQKIETIEDPSRLPVFIFIPTVNEGVAVLEQTIYGALGARANYLSKFPHAQVTIVLCNDGYVAKTPNWEETEVLAKRLNVVCVTRQVKGGAKAGNIENARRLVGATGDALIVIFDADQIAKPDFLLSLIPPFADPTIGWVQSSQHYSNLDNLVSRWAEDQQSLFYRILCPGKSSYNAAFICGTNVVLRASMLDEIGGLPQDSVTEDFAASILLHPRWRSIFVPGIFATGLGPMTFKAYLKQQDRWAIGTLSVFRQYWRRVFLPWEGNLTLSQRIQYALACTHYLCGIRDLIYILAPIVFILTSISAIRGADLGTFLWHFVPYWIASQVAFWYVAWGKVSIRGILIGFGCCFTLLGSLATVITGRRVGFTITPKSRGKENTWRPYLPHIAAFVLCSATLIFSLTRQAKPGEQGTMLVSTFWIGYTLALLGGLLWLGYRESTDFKVRGPIFPRLPSLSLWHSRQQFKWVVLTAIPTICIVTAILFTESHSSVFAAVVPKFSVRTDKSARLFGLTLPADLLQSQPSLVESKLNIRPTILGRIQDVSDKFDTTWANKLTAQGQRPWITLLFHIEGDPAYMSSLPAITNGVYDAYLKQWALSIREYGKPVYLTILPYADRNWSISSAVTNGGIPQDVPRAWQHVQEVFADMQADNVAWVWAAADPAHDQSYAPPASAIDAVDLTLISYPQTQWADPQKELQALEARYPNMPVFLEVSASGLAQDKANWLRQIGLTVANDANVRAVLYHDGSPDTNATSKQHQPWLIISDPLSIDAAKDMLTTIGLKSSSTAQNGMAK